MTDIITAWLPTVSNWIVMGIIVYVAYKGYAHVTEITFQRIVDKAVAKLDDKVKTLNALRNIKQ